jgi:hypothetical protein
MRLQRAALLLAVVLALLVPATASYAYNEDTHYLVTYVVLRATGFTADEALMVAAVDEGMDNSSDTTAILDGFLPNMPQEWLWHAFDLNGNEGAAGIIRRKDKLFSLALNRQTTRDRLICLGTYLHFLQDTWAHRHHYEGNPASWDAYTTYTTPLGHALDGHQPDDTPFDPVTAFHMVEDTFNMASQFLQQALGRDPNPFFAGYQSLYNVVAIDKNWPQNSEYYHQLRSVAGATAAQEFLIRLVQAQVDSYTESIDWNPNFFLCEDANEADLDTVRQNFQSVCDTTDGLGVSITVPTEQDKLNEQNAPGNNFGNMTTAGLLAIFGAPPAP